MKRPLVCFSLLILVGSAYSATVADIVSLVSKAQYQDFMDKTLYTHDGNDRRAGSGLNHDQARDNINNYLNGLSGVTSTINHFTYGAVSGDNVVAQLTGTRNPEKILVIGSHYDSVGNPGADDNASGCAGVLEAARVLSQYKFDYTIRFVAFDSEELYLYGSSAYAQSCASLGENIVGMVSLDMIAYNDQGLNQAFIYGRDTSDPTKNALAEAISLYGNGITTTIYGGFDASDHAPFEWNGYQACLLIENYHNNPNYHTQQDSYDTPGYLDFTYATNMTRSAVGWAAGQAGVSSVPEPLTIIGIGLGLAAVASRRRKR